MRVCAVHSRSQKSHPEASRASDKSAPPRVFVRAEGAGDVRNLMNTNPLTALESDNLQVAENRMREAKVQCLIVKNQMNEVVGVIQIFE